MKKNLFIVSIIIFLTIFLILFLVGCKEKTCSQEYPYESFVNKECCEDVNQNQVCDENEELFKELDSVQKKIDECLDEAYLLDSVEQWDKSRDKYFECRTHIQKGSRLINNILETSEDKEFQDDSTIGYFNYQIIDAMTEFDYVTAKVLANPREIDIPKAIVTEKSIQAPLASALYYLWEYKQKFPKQYKENDMSEMLDTVVREYKGANQRINDLYDDFTKDPFYKYYAQVDIEDSMIIEIADKLSEGKSDQTEIALALLDYVRQNVEYKHDPNWMTDWVNTPRLTLVYGRGDCDDMAVLLVSLMARAGVTAELCDADTNLDGYPDHLTVRYNNLIYEPTCSDCGWEASPSDSINWDVSCSPPDVYLMEAQEGSSSESKESILIVVGNSLLDKVYPAIDDYAQAIREMDIEVQVVMEHEYQDYLKPNEAIFSIGNPCTNSLSAELLEINCQEWNSLTYFPKTDGEISGRRWNVITGGWDEEGLITVLNDITQKIKASNY